MNTELIMMKDGEDIARVLYVCLRGLAILSIHKHETDLHCNYIMHIHVLLCIKYSVSSFKVLIVKRNTYVKIL